MSKCLKSKLVNTRKHHVCFGCGREIPSGSQAFCETWVDDTINTTYLCLVCESFASTVLEYGDEYSEHSLPECDPELWECRRIEIEEGDKMNKRLMKKTKERCKQFLVENGWKHDVDNDDGDYESYYKTTHPIVDIGNDEIVFVDNNGDFLHLPVNYYALIGGLIECQMIDMGYKSV